MIRSLAAGMALAATQPAMAATLHVGEGQPWATIQAAIGDATHGDVIEVHAGTYPERLVFNGFDQLTVRAHAGESVVLDVPDAMASGMIVLNAHVVILGLTIEAPAHAWAASRAVRIFADGPGAIDSSVTLCGAVLRDHGVAGGHAVECVGGGDHVVSVGFHGSTSAFDRPLGPGCERSARADVAAICEAAQP